MRYYTHMLTLGQAAKEVNKTKTTLANAIKAGRLSATRDERGQYHIDPAELFRVYPVKGLVLGDNRLIETGTLQREIELLRDQLQREREINRRLFDRLDEEAGERRKLTALLTHQAKPGATPDHIEHAQADPSKSQLWRKLFGRGCA